jgi:GT2 family glycosyltransferase
VSNTVEILVVSYGSERAIAQLLNSLRATLPDTPVAIREHAAEAAHLRAIEQLAACHTAPVRIEHDPTNPGFGAGCNALARRSTAEFLLFLNPDTELVAWPWSDAHAPPRQTVVGPRMVGSGGPGEHFGRTYRIRDEIARSWLRRKGHRPSGRGFVSGACLLLDRSSFESLGGFDEGYFMFYEDIDLCLRANEEGLATMIEDAWIVRHAGAHSTRKLFATALIWSYESGTRFHGRTRGAAGRFRLYVSVDSSLRAIMHAARRNRSAATAYLHLARRASSDLIRHRSAEARDCSAVDTSFGAASSSVDRPDQGEQRRRGLIPGRGDDGDEQPGALRSQE